MPTLTIRFYIDGTQLEEVEVDAPTDTSVKSLIEDTKRGLDRCFPDRSRTGNDTVQLRLSSRLSSFTSLGRASFTGISEDDLPPPTHPGCD